MEKQLNKIDGEMKTTGWVEGWGGRSVHWGMGSWIGLYVYPCLRTSWRHKCQLWAVCGLPTKLLARSVPDWFCLLDSWHATNEPWPLMCHSNAMASQPPLTSVLMDIRVSLLCSRLRSRFYQFLEKKMVLNSITGRIACTCLTLLSRFSFKFDIINIADHFRLKIQGSI